MKNEPIHDIMVAMIQHFFEILKSRHEMFAEQAIIDPDACECDIEFILRVLKDLEQEYENLFNQFLFID